MVDSSGSASPMPVERSDDVLLGCAVRALQRVFLLRSPSMARRKRQSLDPVSSANILLRFLPVLWQCFCVNAPGGCSQCPPVKMGHAAIAASSPKNRLNIETSLATHFRKLPV
ncbi:hypothetical protein AAC387_Pa09g0491 [Persea americana]